MIPATAMEANGARLRQVLAMVYLAGVIAGAAAAVYHSLHTSSPLTFYMSTVDDNSTLGTSGLIGQDIDGDGFLDLVSFAYVGTTAGAEPGEIYWYQYAGAEHKRGHPSWTRRLIAKKARPVHGAFIDVDGDGHQDLIFFSDFLVPIQNASTQGSIWWARRPPEQHDLEQAEEWEVFRIGRSLGAHRIVAVPDLDGSGAWGVVVVPLVNPGPFPIYGPGPVTLYIPDASDPTLPWSKTVSSQLFHVAHDAVLAPPHFPTSSSTAGDTVIIACAEGIQELTFRQQEAGVWELRFATAHPPPTYPEDDLVTPPRDLGFQVLGLENPAWNLSGVTALAASPGNAPGGAFLAAIDYTTRSGYLSNEPWHGDTVSVYQTVAGGGLQRKVLEQRDAGGHHVKIADFNLDGCLDVAAGFRAYPTSLLLYLCVPGGDTNTSVRYEKQIISERAAQQLVVHDWNRDGFPDIATCGDGVSGDPYILLWTNQGRGGFPLPNHPHP